VAVDVVHFAIIQSGDTELGGDMKTGFIGLGNMGAAMAGNLVRAGHEVTVYNRNPDKAAALLGLGARRAATVAEACRGDVVMTMLADDAALDAVALGDGGIVGALGQGAIHISMSTISVALSKRLQAAHARAGQRYVSAPVFGRPDMAAAAKLFVVAAGEDAALQACQPLFDAIGQKTFPVGAEPSAANVVKIGGNFLIAAAIESLGEAIALVGKAGVDRGTFVDVLTSTLFNAPVYKTYGNLIAKRTYTPALFAAPLGLKDVRLALGAADELQVPLPLGSLLRDRFLRLLAHGGEDLDWSAIGDLASQDSAQEHAAS
jgi:3-hydroxyisobutyrate dehydrogenase-like beta-hydroxyacid dehydrogenase